MLELAPSRHRDWSREELASIDRISTICRSIGCLELECQCTDEGDPWCIIYDRACDRVVLHLARIERKYVVVLPLQQRFARRASMTAIYEIAVSEMDCIYRQTLMPVSSSSTSLPLMANASRKFPPRQRAIFDPPAMVRRVPTPIVHYEPFAHGPDRRPGKVAKLISLQVRLTS